MKDIELNCDKIRNAATKVEIFELLYFGRPYAHGTSAQIISWNQCSPVARDRLRELGVDEGEINFEFEKMEKGDYSRWGKWKN